MERVFGKLLYFTAIMGVFLQNMKVHFFWRFSKLMLDKLWIASRIVLMILHHATLHLNSIREYCNHLEAFLKFQFWKLQNLILKSLRLILNHISSDSSSVIVLCSTSFNKYLGVLQFNEELIRNSHFGSWIEFAFPYERKLLSWDTPQGKHNKI